MPKLLQDAIKQYSSELSSLRSRNIYLISGNFDADLGIVGLNSIPESHPFWVKFGETGLQRLIRVLSKSSVPAQVVRLSTLAGMFLSTPSEDELEIAVPNARLTVYGTDGSRGEVTRESMSIAEALRAKLKNQQMSATFFEGLVAATIVTMRELGHEIENVPVGWDTRDLFAQEGHAGIFRNAIVSGVLKTGANALKLGVTPIAASSYILASLKGKYSGLCLSFNKTASHNPPAHDGLKSFIFDQDKVRKLRVNEEQLITAKLFHFAVGDGIGLGSGDHKAEVVDERESLGQCWQDVLLNQANYGMTGESWRAAQIVYDGANGAAGDEMTRELMLKALQAASSTDTVVKTVACSPNGQNINDHCGAGSLEGIHELDETKINASFSEFESVLEVWRAGRKRREQSQEDGRLVYGIATDGDSDRSYTFFYDPFMNKLRFIDGDSAIFLQFSDYLDNSELAQTNKVSFTIESAANFAQALMDRGQQTQTVSMHMFGTDCSASNSKVKLYFTPVGDKWVLETGPNIGGEATGHLIRPVKVRDSQGSTHVVHAGNGPLGLLATIGAFERRLANESQLRPETLNGIVQPFAPGLNLACYVYFVERSRFFRGGDVWHRTTSKINEIVSAILPDYNAEIVDFAAVPNTYMLLVRKANEVLASVHVRCSGTEPKIGLKASAADHSELRELVQRLDQEIFELLIESMFDPDSSYWQRQLLVLTALSESGPASVDELRNVARGDAADDALFQSQWRFLLKAMKRQGLLAGSDSSVSLSNRGLKVVEKFRS